MVSTRSTRSSVTSPRNDWISCTSHWNSSVVSGVSGRIQPAPRSRTAPIRWSFRQTPTRCRVGVGGRVMSKVNQRMVLKVTLYTSHVNRYTPERPSCRLRREPAVDHHDARRVPIRDLVRYYLRLGL